MENEQLETKARQLQLEDFGPVEPHHVCAARLKAEHGKKTGFWSRMDG